MMNKHRNCINPLLSALPRSLKTFQSTAAEVAIPEHHHTGLAGHETLIEFCTADESMMGKVREGSWSSRDTMF